MFQLTLSDADALGALLDYGKGRGTREKGTKGGIGRWYDEGDGN